MTDETTKAAARRTSVKAEEPKLSIYERINLISQEAGALAPESKGGVPFAFRGIDGTVAHLTPFLHKYGVFLAPETVIAQVTPTPVGNRTVKTTETLVTYGVYGPDGKSDIVLTVPGLADDFADRSTAQAMSVAYRIALLQLFHLPTHSKEPEETGEEVQKQLATGTSAPSGPKAVNAAKAAQAPTESNISRLQQECKALGRSLGLEPADLNALGEKLSGGKEQAVWFNDVFVMEQIRDSLKAKATE